MPYSQTSAAAASAVCDVRIHSPSLALCVCVCVYTIYICVFVSLAVRFNTLIRPDGPVFVWSLNGGLVSAAQAWLDELNQTIRGLSPEKHLTTSY